MKPIQFQTNSMRACRNVQPGVWPAKPIDPERPAKWVTRRIMSAKHLMAIDHHSPQEICPYGAPGSVLWARETWAVGKYFDAVKPRDLVAGVHLWFRSDEIYGLECLAGKGKWRPPRHHPKALSRHRMEIVAVRVERLHMMPATDLVAEGLISERTWKRAIGFYAYSIQSQIKGFKAGWDKINGKGSYEANPMVWVIEFKRLEDSTPTP